MANERHYATENTVNCVFATCKLTIGHLLHSRTLNGRWLRHCRIYDL